MTPALSRTASPARQADVELAPMAHEAEAPAVEWTKERVGQWARAEGIDEQVAAKLERQEVDGDTLLAYARAKAELRVDLDISVGAAHKLYRAIQRLAASEGGGAAGDRSSWIRASVFSRSSVADVQRSGGGGHGHKKCCYGFGLPGFREIIEVIVILLAAFAFHEIVGALETVGLQKQQLDDLTSRFDTLDKTASHLENALTDAQEASARAQAAADEAKQTAADVEKVSKNSTATVSKIVANMEEKLQTVSSLDARVHALEERAPVPLGLIATWNGVVSELPEGWAQCDGSHGTPDLRDKFVVAAGNRYVLGSSADAGENVNSSATLHSFCDGAKRCFESAGINGVLSVTLGEPVPAHYALLYVMRVGS